MKLYHFCAPQFVEGILKEGLTKGVTPILVSGQLGFIEGQQWLTENPEFKQSWNSMNLVKYDRTAYRLTVEVPSLMRGHLLKFNCRYKNLLGERMLPGFDANHDCENWWVYTGIIPKKWIVALSRKAEAK